MEHTHGTEDVSVEDVGDGGFDFEVGARGMGCEAGVVDEDVEFRCEGRDRGQKTGDRVRGSHLECKCLNAEVSERGEGAGAASSGEDAVGVGVEGEGEVVPDAAGGAAADRLTGGGSSGEAGEVGTR